MTSFKLEMFESEAAAAADLARQLDTDMRMKLTVPSAPPLFERACMQLSCGIYIEGTMSYERVSL